MILFQCDYNEGAHPKILERLMATNLEQTVGYGEEPDHVFSRRSLYGPVSAQRAECAGRYHRL